MNKELQIQDTEANFQNTPYLEDLRSNADEYSYSTTLEKTEQSKSSAHSVAKPTQATDSKSILERKERTRKLINIGGLVVKADLEPLPSNTLYGGLLTLRNQLVGKSREEMYAVIDEWTYLGKQAFEVEAHKGASVALKFKFVPPREMLEKLKAIGLKWNALRKEWEGIVTDIETLKEELGSANYSLQIL